MYRDILTYLDKEGDLVKQIIHASVCYFYDNPSSNIKDMRGESQTDSILANTPNKKVEDMLEEIEDYLFCMAYHGRR